MRSALSMAVVIAAATIITAGPAVSPAALAQGTQTVQPEQPSKPSPGSHQGQQNLSQQDHDFIQKLAKGGVMQVELSKIAAEKSDNPKVRKFAVTTIANLGMAGGMLHAMAKEAGIDLPQQPPDDVKKLTDALAADQGSTLDHEYMAQIVPASTVAVNMFKDESSKGENPKFVQFAKQMLPKIEKHQQMAVQLSQNMGVAQAKKEQAPGQPASGSSAPPPSAPQKQ